GYPVESQGALYQSLRAMTDFARIMGVSRSESGRWYADSANALRANFEADFVDASRVADHLTSTGAFQTGMGGNALLALRSLNFSMERAARLARSIAEQSFDYGLPTRSQSDSLFHPYLDSGGVYPEQDAYYNGAVWTWLNGPLISMLARSGAKELAAELFYEHVDRVGGAGLVGAVPQLIDGHPHATSNAPHTGGIPLDPWSQAEFVRNAYMDFIGLEYLSPDTLQLTPNIPDSWGETSVSLRSRRGWLSATIDQNEEETRIVLTPAETLSGEVIVQIRALDTVVDVRLDSTLTDKPINVLVAVDGVEIDGEQRTIDRHFDGRQSTWWEGFTWAEPALPDSYPVLDVEVIQARVSPDEILRDNLAASIILSQADPVGDDWGATSTYTYPSDFPSSVLDATFLEIAEDDSATYFRGEFVRLAGPDSTGSSRTFVAIAIDTEEGGSRTVDRNAGYNYPRGGGYEYILYLGAGLRVEDATGRTIVEVPADVGAVFDYASGSFSFRLPQSVFPALRRGAGVTMLVGAMDPWEGPGRFRRVDRGPAGLNGGGKVDPRSPNVYDVVTASILR
ncbi:MAG: glucodextranase DOMON-like domain-containing protein, partial [Rubricoccaceae bacterium]|nr:glucodextranase DOMON-like domain-containing protein [Rubricoccaceae bacterium]